MDAAVALFFVLWALWGKSSAPRAPSAAAPSSLPRGTAVSTSAPPWPQVVPTGLPPFPGQGWQYDEPPPAAVVQRAGQLVGPLWKGGQGTFRIEQTAGRWIAYRAEIVRSGKKGVTAYRVRSGAAPKLDTTTTSSRPLPSPPARPASSTPAATPAAAAEQAGRQAAPVPFNVPPDARLLRTLRRGDGIKPKPPDPDVAFLQRKLGIRDDGRFGAGTESVLEAFQRKMVAAGRPGWSQKDVDGICGPKTWTALLEERA